MKNYKIISIDTRTGEEWDEFETNDKNESITEAQYIWNRLSKYDQSREEIEIRTDEEIDDCGLYSYNTINWR